MKYRNIKSRIKVLLMISALFFMAASCTERIDIELDDSYARLVVEGIITTDSTPHFIKLTKTSSYYYSEKPPAVSNAVVTIDDGESTITLSESEPGVYQTPLHYKAIPGRTYKLNISLDSPISGQQNYSAQSYCYPGLVLDSIKAVYRDDISSKGYYEIKCYAQDPPTKDFYMFRIYRNGVLLSDSLNKVLVTDDRFFNGNYTNGIGVGFLDQSNPLEKVEPGDQMSVESSRITEEYYTFVMQLQMQSGFQTPLFSGPPSNISGNISHDAIGFFTTYPLYKSHTIAQSR